MASIRQLSPKRGGRSFQASGTSSAAHVEKLADDVAGKRERKHAETECEPRKKRYPPLAADDVVGAFADLQSPFRSGRLQPRAHEAQAGSEKQCPSDVDRDLGQLRTESIRQD